MIRKFNAAFAVIALAGVVVAGCNKEDKPDGGGNKPATKVEITALEGTDFGTVQKGNSVTKKFKITADGSLAYYADKYGLSYAAISRNFQFNDDGFAAAMDEMISKNLTSKEFSVTYTPYYDGTVNTELYFCFTGFVPDDVPGSAMLAIRATGANTGLKAPDAEGKTATVTCDPASALTFDSENSKYTLALSGASEVTITLTLNYCPENSVKAGATGVLQYTYDIKPEDFTNDTHSVSFTIKYDGSTTFNDTISLYGATIKVVCTAAEEA